MPTTQVVASVQITCSYTVCILLQQNKEDNIDNQEPNVNDDQDKSQTKPLTSTLSPNETNYENKNVSCKNSKQH